MAVGAREAGGSGGELVATLQQQQQLFSSAPAGATSGTPAEAYGSLLSQAPWMPSLTATTQPGAPFPMPAAFPPGDLAIGLLLPEVYPPTADHSAGTAAAAGSHPVDEGQQHQVHQEEDSIDIDDFFAP